ncbi:hypothetical protein [Robiginitalea sp. SC105]|nr:hypothetical protein [Robiginitalea sp. SC105]
MSSMRTWAVIPLLVIEKDQRFRYQHVGCNPAEALFREGLMETIEGLK